MGNDRGEDTVGASKKDSLSIPKAFWTRGSFLEKQRVSKERTEFGKEIRKACPRKHNKSGEQKEEAGKEERKEGERRLSKERGRGPPCLISLAILLVPGDGT